MSLSACASTSEDGLSKPSIMTSPPSYLASVELGKKSVDDVIEVMGVPDKSKDIAGKSYLSYELGEGY